LLFKLVRGFAFTAGVGSSLLLVLALWTGPSLSILGAVLAWAVVVVGIVLSAAVGVGPLDDLTGARRAKLIRPYRTDLAARVRSAAELAQTPNGSPELIASLTQRVLDELTAVPIATVVPAPPHFRTSFLVAGGVTLLCALSLLTRDDAAAGLYAMLHPGLRNEQGSLVGLWVAGVKAKVTYPASAQREVEQLGDLHSLEVPEGTLLELALTPRFAVDRAVLKLGERLLPFTKTDEGALALTLTAEESGVLELRARIGDSWLSDPQKRELRVANDAAPVVELLVPQADQTAEPEQRVPFVYRVRDDHGLDGIDLVVQLGPDRERRMRLSSYPAQQIRQHAEGSTDVVPAAFGARPGQTIAVWLEARDRDSFGGANVGRSPVRTISIGESDESKGPEVERLRAARDSVLDALGDRLESPLESSDRGRTRKLAKGMKDLVQALSALASSYGDSTPGANESWVREMMRRITRLTRDEATSSEPSARSRIDRTIVSELEEDALWLTDLLGRAKLAAADEAIARLAATRARMRELLEQLKASDDPARRAELKAEIARARAELRDISEKLSEAETDVPGDFVNFEALQRQAGDDPLEQLEKALAEGDIEAAEKALGQLDERMAKLQSGVEGGERAFGNARFAPRNQELERARAEVDELARGQEQLAKESDRLAARARAHGAEEQAFEAANERLAAASEALEKRTRELRAGRMQSAVEETQRTAAQRLRDARDALRQGEAQEARAMADRAASDVDALASEMRLDARMFPGSDGSRMSAAREAEQLARDVARFASEVGANAPRAPDKLSGDEREALRKQAPSQGTLGERTKKLSEQAREQGPASMPSGLDRATDAMRSAESALERGELERARSQQREALDRLREVSDDLAQQEQASKGEGPAREGDGDGQRSEDKVAIPEGGSDARRGELRRRVLDARRAPTPDSYERSVERYYQEILR
jgi:hypothetical protein